MVIQVSTIMLTIEPIIYYHIFKDVVHVCKEHVFFVSILRARPNQIQLKSGI